MLPPGTPAGVSGPVRRGRGFYFSWASRKTLDRLGVADYDFAACGNHHALHPGRTAQLTSGAAGVRIGEASRPSAKKKYGVTARVLLGDLDRELICAHAGMEAPTRPCPASPTLPGHRLVCAKPAGQADRRIIQVNIPDILESLTLFEVYGANDPLRQKEVLHAGLPVSGDADDETVEPPCARLDALSAQGIPLRRLNADCPLHVPRLRCKMETRVSDDE